MDLVAAMELRVKADQAKAALAATRGAVVDLGAASKTTSVQGAQIGPALAGAGAKATPAMVDLTAKAKVLGAELSRVSVATADVGARSFAAGGGARMLGQQLSQVGQQGAITGDYLHALAIQLPDMALGFGGVAIAASIVATIAIPALINMWNAGGQSAKTLDERITDLTSATQEYEAAATAARTPISELRTEYGELADEVQRALLNVEKLAYAKAQRAADDALNETGLTSGLGSEPQILAQFANLEKLRVAMVEIERLKQDALNSGQGPIEAMASALAEFDTANPEAGIYEMVSAADQFNASLQEIARTYKITIEQASELANAGALADQAQGAEAQVAATTQLLAVMTEVFGSIEAADAATGGLASKLSEAVLAGANIVAVTDEMTAALGDAAVVARDLASIDMSGNIAGATAEAYALAGALGIALSKAVAIANVKPAPRGPNLGFGLPSLGDPVIGGVARLEFGDRPGAPGSRDPGFNSYVPPAVNIPNGGAGAGGGGGAARGASASLASLQAEAQAALAALDTAIAAINEKVKLGLLSTAEGTEAVGKAKERAATAIADLIPKLEKLGPATNKVVEGLRAKVGGFVTEIGAAGSDMAQKLSGNFETGFAAFITGAKDGKEAMADFGTFVLAELARIASQKFTSSVISPLLDSIIGSIFPHAAGGVPEGVAGSGGLGAHANTIVGAPTLFAMAGGQTGLMGEAGPEAIMPTRPAPGGGLGVLAQGPDGRAGVLPLQRMPGGDLGVAIAAMAVPPAVFAKGGVPAGARGGALGVAIAAMAVPPVAFAKGGVPAWSAPILRHPPMLFARGGVVAGLSGANGFEDEDGPERTAQTGGPSGAGRRRSAPGPGSDISMPVSIVVHNSGPDTTARAETRQQGGTSFIEVFIDQIRDRLAGDVTQGNGPFPQAMQSSYGLSRVGS